jgi:hypothetical protein
MKAQKKVINERSSEYDISIAIPFFVVPDKMSQSMDMLWSAGN